GPVPSRSVSRMVRSDLACPGLAPGEERPADTPAADGRIDEADLVVCPAAVGLVAPLDPAVPDDPPVDLDDQQVAVHVRVRQVGVLVRQRLDRYRLVDARVAAG